MKEIKILLADDHEIFRNGLVQLINKEQDMQVVGEASSGNEAVEMLYNKHVDLLIFDIRMPGLNGLEAAEELLKKNNELKIIIFSLYGNKDYVTKALSLGVSGFLLKDTSNKIFLEAIRSVNDGKLYYNGEVSDMVIRYLKSKASPMNHGDLPDGLTNIVKLSRRELEILELIESGCNSKQTADKLGLSVRTIDAHRLNILRKYSLKSMDEVLDLRKVLK